ncbi:HK97 gp10 family phage protein [Mesorhizobium sp. B2-2-4]|uniref:HK97-gp10 family putative phage morphogenesis protein n=1 Tax=unclassified Mesorhizobium TaxID=325217 RepID=UPI00112ABB14|nr:MULTISPECIES: HK97-gp10 family putative phage morphogenesis protein [unclassified Mesorhizobium]TPM61102.1 HK97 gp10 family phage protein [Mesorhizobium sp. B2-2-4]TPM70534.1 HK97 gp10 family phage protein [Mesorhizobium sp. B2-2-1]TPN70386.1 HK97 gp10 family phage protein [Mesorhizobium sp. B1-1-3]
MANNDNGLASTLAAIERARKAPRAAVLPALLKSAEELAGAQRALAERSRDTGALIDSIEVTPPGHSTPPYSQPGGMRVAGETEVLVTAGNEDVRYAHLVEFGTSKTEAEPFFWPAVRLLRKRLQNRINRAARKAVKDAWSGQ